MEDVDYDSFGDHEPRTEEPTDENIPLIPRETESHLDSESDEETSFGADSQRV